jgi:hypothetical protein
MLSDGYFASSKHICPIFSIVKSTLCCLVQSNVTYQAMITTSVKSWHTILKKKNHGTLACGIELLPCLQDGMREFWPCNWAKLLVLRYVLGSWFMSYLWQFLHWFYLALHYLLLPTFIGLVVVCLKQLTNWPFSMPYHFQAIKIA